MKKSSDTSVISGYSQSSQVTFDLNNRKDKLDELGPDDNEDIEESESDSEKGAK